MSGVAGKWKVEVNTPMGKQTFTLMLTVNGAAVTGKCESPMGALDVLDGKADGNSATWQMKMTSPMPMTFDTSVTADGDKMTGQMKTGMFPAWALAGGRAA